MGSDELGAAAMCQSALTRDRETRTIEPEQTAKNGLEGGEESTQTTETKSSNSSLRY